ATKTITTGEGGCICTNDDTLADRARLIRNHGMRGNKRYWHETIGHNFRLTNLQAALGYAQLEHVNQIIENKKRVFARYQANLQNQSGVHLQQITSQCDPVMWAVALKIDPTIFGQTRDALIEALKDEKIETRPGFYPFSDMPIYQTAPLTHSV